MVFGYLTNAFSSVTASSSRLVARNVVAGPSKPSVRFLHSEPLLSSLKPIKGQTTKVGLLHLRKRTLAHSLGGEIRPRTGKHERRLIRTRSQGPARPVGYRQADARLRGRSNAFVPPDPQAGLHQLVRWLRSTMSILADCHVVLRRSLPRCLLRDYSNGSRRSGSTRASRSGSTRSSGPTSSMVFRAGRASSSSATSIRSCPCRR